MEDVRVSLRALVEKARALHLRERDICLESVLLVGELERRNAAVNVGMSAKTFVKHLGLTPNQYWKRAQAARVIRRFPRALALARSGETGVAQLALVAPKITEANSSLILDGIRDKSKREVESFLSRVTCDGKLREKSEGEVELRVKLKDSDAELLERAKEVLSHSGRVPRLSEVIARALADPLEKRDPLKKAARAQARQEGKKREREREREQNQARAQSQSHQPNTLKAEKAPSQKSPSPGKRSVEGRPSVPALTRHSVWLRDEGQCTWTFPDGTRCEERARLELDHLDMWCRTLRHDPDRLTLRCRRHNQFAAELVLGAEFMAKARQARERRTSN